MSETKLELSPAAKKKMHEWQARGGRNGSKEDKRRAGKLGRAGLTAKMLGYQIVKASAIEVVLTKNGHGVRTWFASEFDGELPKLSNPKVQDAIRLNESRLAEEAEAAKPTTA